MAMLPRPATKDDGRTKPSGPDVLLYIKESQVDWVFAHNDVGSGTRSFAGMRELGGRVFVISRTRHGIAVIGEISIAESYEDPGHRWGWRYRVKGTQLGAKRYLEPVVLVDFHNELELLQRIGKAWPSVRYPTHLSPEDAEVIARAGKASGVAFDAR